MIETGSSAESVVRSDVCIVGSGPAGMTVALELERHGIDCVLLESGGRTPDAEHAALNETPQIGITTDPTVANRLRALGGTSVIWGGFCRRLDELDFERRPWVSDSGWPIGLADLMPYYEIAHRILGLPSAEYGLDRLDPAEGGATALRGTDFENVVFYYNGRPRRFGEFFVEALEGSSRIKTYLDSTAIDIATDDRGRRVAGIEVSTLGGRRFRVEARRYVIASGTINTARLLLNSDRVQHTGLGNENDLVGRYFMQHPVWRAPNLLLFDKDKKQRVRRSDKIEISIATAIRPGPAREKQLLNFHFLAISQKAPSGINQRRHFARSVLRGLRQRWAGPTRETMASEALRELEAELVPGSLPQPFSMRMEIRPEQAPNRASRITLGDRRDSLGMREAVMDWRLGDLDHQSLQRGLRLLARSMALENVGRVRASDEDLAIQEPQSAYLHGGHHHFGTTRMSDSPKRGVVDRNGRVHSLDNLYIAGSAVFPTTGYANPTLSIVAMAARLAAHLAK